MLCKGVLCNQPGPKHMVVSFEIDETEQFRIAREVISQTRAEALDQITPTKTLLYGLEAKVRACDEALKVI